MTEEIFRPGDGDDDYVEVLTRGDEVVGITFGGRALPFEQVEVTANVAAAWREHYDNGEINPLTGVVFYE